MKALYNKVKMAGPTVDGMVIRKESQRASIAEALACGTLPDLVVGVKPTTTQEKIGKIVSELGRLGVIYGVPDPSIEFYSIGVSPHDKNSAKQILDYCDSHPDVVSFVSPDGVTVGESRQYRTIDGYLG